MYKRQVLGIIGILILAECCRRVVGIPILCVATAFVLYAYLPMFAGKTVQSIVYNLFYTCLLYTSDTRTRWRPPSFFQTVRSN